MGNTTFDRIRLQALWTLRLCKVTKLPMSRNVAIQFSSQIEFFWLVFLLWFFQPFGEGFDLCSKEFLFCLLSLIQRHIRWAKFGSPDPKTLKVLCTAAQMGSTSQFNGNLKLEALYSRARVVEVISPTSGKHWLDLKKKKKKFIITVLTFARYN